jgi:hypothetical protein
MRNFIYVEPITSYWWKDHNFWLKIDYHEHDFLQREKEMFGKPGENGQPVYVAKEEEQESERVCWSLKERLVELLMNFLLRSSKKLAIMDSFLTKLL